jgi:hypothetical protein
VKAPLAAVHMSTMTTEAATPMFAHFVPDEEPPVGTVASFQYSFASGGGSATGFMMRGASGWSDGPNPQPHNIRTWQSLADLEFRNAEIQRRSPGSTAVFIAIEVRIHSTPPVDRVGDRAHLAKLEHAVFTAAERLGIQTEGVPPTKLVTTIATLAEIRGRA